MLSPDTSFWCCENSRARKLSDALGLVSRISLLIAPNRSPVIIVNFCFPYLYVMPLILNHISLWRAPRNVTSLTKTLYINCGAVKWSDGGIFKKCPNGPSRNLFNSSYWFRAIFIVSRCLILQ